MLLGVTVPSIIVAIIMLPPEILIVRMLIVYPAIYFELYNYHDIKRKLFLLVIPLFLTLELVVDFQVYCAIVVPSPFDLE